MSDLIERALSRPKSVLERLRSVAVIRTDLTIDQHNTIAEAADALEANAKRITELEASLADSNEALQVMGLKLERAEGHSANTVGGPTPGAASACEQPLNDNAQKEAS